VADSTRITPGYVTAALAAVGIALIVVGIVYFVEPAASLPSFFPGHLAGSKHHHTTHGIAALIVGALAIVGSWMSAGKKQAA
jgi:predicted phage tail protein